MFAFNNNEALFEKIHEMGNELEDSPSTKSCFIMSKNVDEKFQAFFKNQHKRAVNFFIDKIAKSSNGDFV